MARGGSSAPLPARPAPAGGDMREMRHAMQRQRLRASHAARHSGPAGPCSGACCWPGPPLQAVPAGGAMRTIRPVCPYAPYQTAPLPPAGAAQPPAGAPVTATEPPPINLTQRGIPAEASAENGVLARERALAAGRRLPGSGRCRKPGCRPPRCPTGRSRIWSVPSSSSRNAPPPTRYTGRITVVFNPNRVRAALGGRPGWRRAPPRRPVAAATPASNWVEAVATYSSMGEWLELQRRLKRRLAGCVGRYPRHRGGCGAAAGRAAVPGDLAASDLATLGVALEPAAGPPGLSWHLGLARGG